MILKRYHSLAKPLAALFVVSIILSSSSFSQSLNINVSAQNQKEHKFQSPTNQSETNDSSKAILEKVNEALSKTKDVDGKNEFKERRIEERIFIF